MPPLCTISPLPWVRLGAVLLALASAPMAQRQAQNPLRIVAQEPRPNASRVPRDTSILLRFDRALKDPVLSPRNLHVLGRWSGVTPATYRVEERGRALRVTPLSPFSAGERVTVVLARGFEDEFGQTLERGFAWSFWIASRASSATWTQVDTLVPGVVPYGAYGGDLDEDGDLDLCIPNEGTANVSVFLNYGGGYGIPVHYPVGRRCSANEGADLDFDGKLDLVVENIDDDDVSVLLGNGDGTFLPQMRFAVGDQPRGLALLDADGDGDLDIATANRTSSDVSLLLGRGDGTFEPEIRFEGGVAGEKGCCAADMNGDGAFDLVVIGIDDDCARVLLNDGFGTFTPGPKLLVGDRPWMVEAADADGDGWTDVGIALAGSVGAVDFCRGDGQGGLLAPTTHVTGPFTIAVDFGDLTGDGLLDMTGSSFNGQSFTLFQNTGTAFSPLQVLPALGAGSCTVLHDVDGDGDLDVTGIDEVADRVYLFLQDG